MLRGAGDLPAVLAVALQLGFAQSLLSAAAPQVPEPPPERLADERPLPPEPVLRYLRRHRPHLPMYAPAAGERGAGGAAGRARL